MNYFQLQHFITESVWDGRKSIDMVAEKVSRGLPKHKLTGLIIDESGWKKKAQRVLVLGISTVVMLVKHQIVR